MQSLYACPNVKTTTWAAKINQPPMKAFRAPGFVEGTFGLESLIDELASKLGLDPLELRRKNYADSDPSGERPYSSKNLMECYRRAEPHWERRHEVRARSTDTVKRGVGMASQVWYGGGGPPSYAWIRVGSDGRANGRHRDAGHRHRLEDRDGADRGGGARHPARARDGVARRLGARPVRLDLGRLVDDPVDGACSARRGRRREAADHRDRRAALRPRRARARPQGRQCRLGRREPERPARRRGRAARERADPRQGRARAEPDRDDGAHVRRAGRRGRRRRRDRRGLGRPHRSDPRRRPRDQPARRAEPGRGRDHPGDRPHALRAPPARSANRPDPHDRASTRTSCRRSPTSRRSSAS